MKKLALAVIMSPMLFVPRAQATGFNYGPTFSFYETETAAREGVKRACDRTNNGVLVGEMKCFDEGKIHVCAQPCKFPSKYMVIDAAALNKDIKEKSAPFSAYGKAQDLLQAEENTSAQCKDKIKLSRPSCAPDAGMFYCTIICAEHR